MGTAVPWGQPRALRSAARLLGTKLCLALAPVPAPVPAPAPAPVQAPVLAPLPALSCLGAAGPRGHRAGLEAAPPGRSPRQGGEGEENGTGLKKLNRSYVSSLPFILRSLSFLFLAAASPHAKKKTSGRFGHVFTSKKRPLWSRR